MEFSGVLKEAGILIASLIPPKKLYCFI